MGCMALPKRYVHVLTPGTCECDLIEEKGQSAGLAQLTLALAVVGSSPTLGIETA